MHSQLFGVENRWGGSRRPPRPNEKVKLRGRLVGRNVVESRNAGPVNFNDLFGPATRFGDKTALLTTLPRPRGCAAGPP